MGHQAVIQIWAQLPDKFCIIGQVQGAWAEEEPAPEAFDGGGTGPALCQTDLGEGLISPRLSESSSGGTSPFLGQL